MARLNDIYMHIAEYLEDENLLLELLFPF
ncbi:hypothetical protein BDFB_011672 [Asbolus verrucosus]|uniref:Uncharacterized protein n=1 Tax=Asbolus verrucosus TaxID=1661398 RepID=A0A482VXC0_ASBVE|nr:hypothetical protein BDFB_011672 [Asbolus verrucosus]